MTPRDLPSFVEPPVWSSKPKSFSLILESPVKVTKKRMQENEIVSPHRPRKRPKPSNFVESPKSTQSKTCYTNRKGAKNPVKPQKKKYVNSVSSGDSSSGFFNGDGGGFFDGDGGGFFNEDYNDYREYNESPEKSLEKGNGVKDGVDWSVKDKEVERLKAKVVPVYWESLLDTLYSVVWVTERLYILRDWDRLGNLTVTL
jgi:hypothetical protein